MKANYKNLKNNLLSMKNVKKVKKISNNIIRIIPNNKCSGSDDIFEIGKYQRFFSKKFLNHYILIDDALLSDYGMFLSVESNTIEYLDFKILCYL